MAAVWSDLVARESNQRQLYGRDIYTLPRSRRGPGDPYCAGRCADSRRGFCAVATVTATLGGHLFQPLLRFFIQQRAQGFAHARVIRV